MYRAKQIKIGDIFSVTISHRWQNFFQYIANDVTMLNSSVIRAFKKNYNIKDMPSATDIIQDDVDFHAHVFVRNGVKLGYWKKVGHSCEIGETDLLFRDSWDYGNPKVKKSENWHVWKISAPFVEVGKLKGKNREAEIGIVLAPDDVVDRMRTGKFHFVYPEA